MSKKKTEKCISKAEMKLNGVENWAETDLMASPMPDKNCKNGVWVRLNGSENGRSEEYFKSRKRLHKKFSWKKSEMVSNNCAISNISIILFQANFHIQAHFHMNVFR